MAEAAEVLMALGAVDGSTALGFAMQVHVIGALVDSVGGAGRPPRSAVRARSSTDGALVNNAATEEGGGSPARGAIPGTIAVAEADGTWRLTGEKTWTTWLPNLTHAFVTARSRGHGPGRGRVVAGRPRLADGVERRPGFEALGMRGSASGRLVLDGVAVPADALLVRRRVDEPDPRGPAPGAWFGIAIAATYLGVGEGARARSLAGRSIGGRATARRSVADVPSVQLRLGRLDAELRAARIVVLDVARRWDEAMAGEMRPAWPPRPGTCRSPSSSPRAPPSTATDEALRIAGGPGFLAGRLERAFRDARAGLINPPLEDVALTGFGAVLPACGTTGDMDEPAIPGRPPTSRSAGRRPRPRSTTAPGHMIVHGNAPFVEAFGPASSASPPARRCSACRPRPSS